MHKRTISWVYFDSPTLTWKNRINETIKNCNKRLNIMKATTTTTWGAGCKTLLMLYKTCVHSKIEHGSVALGSACNTILNKHEVVQNNALRISIGALRSTPILSLRCEVNTYPLKDRFDYNLQNYFNKAHYLQQDNPIKSVILADKKDIESWNWSHSANKKPAVLRAEAVRSRLNLPLIVNNENILLPKLPPWEMCSPQVKTQLIILEKILFLMI